MINEVISTAPTASPVHRPRHTHSPIQADTDATHFDNAYQTTCSHQYNKIIPYLPL